MEGGKRWIGGRQSSVELLGGDESFGDSGWQCDANDCTTPSTTGWTSCNGNCLHFSMNGGSNAQVGAQRTVSASPIVNGGYSFTLNFNVLCLWTPTGSVTTFPAGMINFQAIVGGTVITKPLYVGGPNSANTWYPYSYQGFIPEPYSSDTATVTLGLDAYTPTGDGYYQLFVDSVSLTVPPSTASPPTTDGSSSSSTQPGLVTSHAPTTIITASPSIIVVNGITVTTSVPVTASVSSPITSTTIHHGTISGSPGTVSTQAVAGANVGNTAQEESTSSNRGVIIGGTIAAVFLLVLLALLIWCLLWRKKRRKFGPKGVIDPFHASSTTGFLNETYPSTPLTEFSSSSRRQEENGAGLSEQEQLRQWMNSPSESLPAYHAIHDTRRISILTSTNLDNVREAPQRHNGLRVVGEDEEDGSSNSAKRVVPTKKG